MFDLDPEVASDPFAAHSLPTGTMPRAEREQAAYVRPRGDLRRMKVQTGDVSVIGEGMGRMTPPPKYEVWGQEAGRAV